MISNFIKTAKNENSEIIESLKKDFQSTISKLNLSDRLPSKTYKPSTMKCERNMFFQIVGEKIDEIEPAYNMIGITESGSARHEKLQYYLSVIHSERWKYISVEDYLKEKNITHIEIIKKTNFETLCHDTRYNIRFKVDGILKYDNEYFILEIKTETDRKSFMRTSADPKHIQQSISYSLSLEIEKIFWIYEDRNICTQQYFITTVNDFDKASLIDKINRVNNFVSSNIVPEKCVDRSECKNCKYTTACKVYK